MAIVTINTTDDEQNAVLEALKELQDKPVAMAAIARKAGISPSRVRYVLVDLEDAKRIEKIAVKAINKYYVRYKYKVL